METYTIQHLSPDIDTWLRFALHGSPACTTDAVLCRRQRRRVARRREGKGVYYRIAYVLRTRSRLWRNLCVGGPCAMAMAHAVAAHSIGECCVSLLRPFDSTFGTTTHSLSLARTYSHGFEAHTSLR